MFVPEVVHNDSNIVLILFVPGYFLTRSEITGYCWYLTEDFYGEEADC